MNPLSPSADETTLPPDESPPPENDGITVSARVRLARNLDNTPFPERNRPDEQHLLYRRILAEVDTIDDIKDPAACEMSDLSADQRLLLREQRIVSAEMTRLGKGSGVVRCDDGQTSIMINEEDHIRLQVLGSPEHVPELWRRADHIAQQLEEKLGFAFRHDLGYLTACPSNLGTGLRASVMLHLPALELNGQIDPTARAAQQLGFTLRGPLGEGSDIRGGFAQVSNQSTLGEDEQTILTRLEHIVKRLVQAERNARQTLLRDSPSALRDEVGRAVGILQYAEKLPLEEARMLLGELRIGVLTGLIQNVPLADIDQLLPKTGPGHLTLTNQKTPPDEQRAQLVKKRLFP